MTMTLPSSTDILVVGAGPAGLAMAALLARAGVDALTITRYPTTAHSPRAHITNQRTMEVFRDLGFEDAVKAVATPNAFMRNNVWATSFAGQEIARLETWGAGVERSSDYELASPSAMCNIPQHVLEPAVLQGAQDLGADVRFSLELVSAEQDEDGVTALVRERDTGAEHTIRAKYIVGADGGRSTVASTFGFTFTGESGLGAALNIWLEADLTKYCEHRPGTLFWMTQPGNNYWVGSGTWINVKPYTEWVLLCMYDPADGEPPLDEESLIARAQSTIGDPEVEVTIKAVSTWQINRMVANTYQKGRAFLVGDAAHRHPPANGLGTNTSIQDSFNLAWKLAAVVRGDAHESLLETYNAERQPVGAAVVDRAFKSVVDMGPIAEALGFEPGQSAEDGWASLDDLFGTGSASADRREALAKAIELQNFQFNSHGVEMGQRYASAAVIPSTQPESAGEKDAELYYTPSSISGHVIPHAWLERNRAPISTLDVVGKGRFTLITGVDDAAWRDAAASVGASLGVPIAVERISMGGDTADVYQRWHRLRGIGDSGALLVRPDRVIAWRVDEVPEDAGAALEAALGQVLGR